MTPLKNRLANAGSDDALQALRINPARWVSAARRRELPASALAELATARADAITSAFTKRLKFDPARLGRKPAEAADEAANNGVPVKLPMGVNGNNLSNACTMAPAIPRAQV